MKQLFAFTMFTVMAAPFTAVYGQNVSGGDVLDELELSRALLSEQQDRFGTLDARLIEPLEQLADKLIQLNQFEEAHSLLDRAMQITRVDAGLYTEAQRPLLQKKIANFVSQGDWESARENMEHLLWLYTNKSRRINRVLIDDLLELSRMHTRALAEDNIYWQGYHFRKSSQIRWLALGVAETLWGEFDERLVPIIYEQLRQYHLQTVALARGGPTSYSLRQIAPGSEIMRDRSDVSESFYLTGIGLLDGLYSIYANGESPNPEAVAMANVYLADWHILHGQPELASEKYRGAYQELVEAKVDGDLVNEFFSRPMVIPDTQFYSTVGAAVAAHRNKVVTEGIDNSEGYLSFSEWSTALPDVRNPISSFGTENGARDSNFALFSFSLAGVNKVSRWFSHRYSSTLNTIEQVELLAHYLESPSEEIELLEKLNNLSFRPKLVNGEPQQATGRLKYYLADDAPRNSISMRP